MKRRLKKRNNSEMNKKGLIRYVEPGSAADEGGIKPGDCLLSVNGQSVKDIFDYRFLTANDNIVLLLSDSGGEEYELEIDKDTYEDVGIEFDNPLIDIDRSCSNKCIFCFIDQMPNGMRDTLYFKDDDTRLSFLQGNYVTLTNVSYEELDRIVKYKLSPVNVSVHTTDSELRCKMLNNRFAGDILKKLTVLKNGGITINAQIVLCPDVNDGEYLERSINDLAELSDSVLSLSVVPAGLTKYRDGLYGLRCFTPAECCDIIETVGKLQCKYKKNLGRLFVYLADEFYINAGVDFPEYTDYDEFPQLENGVGMVRLFETEVKDFFQAKKMRIKTLLKDKESFSVSVATGYAAYDMICEMAAIVGSISDKIGINVYRIKNDFFGENITVSGLLTGRDIIAQLKGRSLGRALLLPGNCLRSGDDVLLDDVTVSDIEKALDVKVIAVNESGDSFVKAILGEGGVKV